MAVFLDTSVLPRRGQLRNPVMSAVLRIAERRGEPVCLVSLVVEESVNGRLREAETALERLTESLNQASKVVALEDLYIPPVAEAANAWRAEIEAAFAVVDVAGDDAREALVREARRMKPARNGIGSRDTAIWLTVKRAHLEAGTTTSFVSSNTEDFASKGTDQLHPELASELGGRIDDFRFYTKLDDLISAMAAVADPGEVQTTLPTEVAGALLVNLLSSPEFGAVQDSLAGLAPEAAVDAVLVVNDVTCLRAYGVDESGLALLRIRLDVELPFREGGSTAVGFDARAWADFKLENGVLVDIALESLSPRN